MNKLQHHGILGQKWGVRRYQNPDGTLTSAGKKRYITSETLGKVKDTKSKKRTAYNDAQDAINNANSHTSKYGIRMRKDKTIAADNKRHWDKAYEENNKYNEARQNYKTAVKERKQKIKDTTKDVRENASKSDKIIYNNGTFKRAAKYVVDNDMNYQEAMHEAKKDANRNTALFVASVAGYSVMKYKTFG